MRYSLSHPYRISCSLSRLQLPRPHQIPTGPSTYNSYRPFTGASSSPELLSVRDIPAPHIGHIRVIGLRSPRNRNALSTQLLAELQKEIISLEGTDGSTGGTRVLVLASELDEAFCAGADLKERSRMSVSETHSFVASLRATFKAITWLMIPTISAVSSVALGGGLELALTTDLRVFSEKATVGLPETRLGIVPGAGGCSRLKRLIGRSKAQQIILTGTSVSGSEAWQMGICNYIVHHEEKSSDQEGGRNEEVAKSTGECLSKRRQEVLDKALEVAGQICQGAPVAVAVARAMTTLNPAMEDGLYKKCMEVGRADRDEGLLAFKQKRPPVYQGSQSESGSIFKAETVRSPYSIESPDPSDLGLVENVWDTELSERGALKREMQLVSEMKHMRVKPQTRSRLLETREPSWNSGNPGVRERRPQPKERNNDIVALDPVEEKKMDIPQQSSDYDGVFDLLDDTFNRRKQ